MINNCTATFFAWETGIIRNVLLPTCEILNDHVKKTIILHCGSKAQMPVYDDFRYIPNVHVEWFPFDGTIDPVFSHIHSIIPENEWALILDSDQRPTELLLNNLSGSIDELEKGDYRFGRFGCNHHEYRGGELNWSSGYPQPSRADFMKTNTYSVSALAKMTSGFKSHSNHGMHYGLKSDNDTYLYFPHGINHYKLYSEYYSSIFLTGYFNPSVHSRLEIPEHVEKEAKNKITYEQFTDLKQRHNMLLSNDFNDRVYQNTVPLEFFEFFSNPMFSKENNIDTTHFLDQAFVFCTVYKFSHDESGGDKRFCGGACCKYGERQL